MSLIIFFLLALTVIFSILSVFQIDLMYSLFYFFISILTTATIFFCFGDPLIGSIQIIIYSGAIIVLFLFIVMMFNLDIKTKKYFFFKNKFLRIFSICIFLFFMFSILKIFFSKYDKYFFLCQNNLYILGIVLFKPYILIIECISILLLSALIIIILIAKKNNIFIHDKS